MAYRPTSTPHPSLPPYQKEIRVLGIPLDISSITSSFIKDAMLEDVWHVDLFIKMGDVQVAFEILTHYFMQQFSYLLWCTPPSSTFIKSFIFFYFCFLQVFGCFLGLRSFDSLEGPLTHKQAFLPINFGGIKFIPTTTIALVTYLRSWALIASIIVVRFMVNQCSSFLKF